MFQSPKDQAIITREMDHTSLSGIGSAPHTAYSPPDTNSQAPSFPGMYRCTPQGINSGISISNYSPLLLLPAEIFENIVLFLRPPEAICLSLTCRTLYFGSLSSQNRYLWYLVGNFAYAVPGYNSKWKIQAQAAAAAAAAADRQGLIPRNGCNKHSSTQRTWLQWLCASRGRGPRLYRSLTSSRSRDLSELKVGPLGQLISKLERLYQEISVFSPKIDYKGIIVDTMMGDTESGCQWCLRSPLILEKPPRWGLKICSPCYWIYMQPWLSIHERNSDSKCKLLLEIQSDVLGLSHKAPVVVPIVDRGKFGLRFVWRPTVEQLLRNQYGPGETIDTVLQQRQHDPKASKYNKYFHYLFNTLKMEYRVSAGGSTTYIPDPTHLFRDLINKLTPEDLRPEWFFKPFPRSASRADILRWMEYCKQDEIMTVLHEDSDLCQSRLWVLDGVAKVKLGQIVSIFGNKCGNNNLPSTWLSEHHIPKHLPLKKLASEIWEFLIQWHIDQANAGGVQLLLERMNAANGKKGLECPWSSSALVCEGEYFPTVRHLILHLSTHCFPLIVRGDTNWLVGKPSQYWLDGLLTVSSDQRKLVRYTAAAQQKDWLQKWWPERWQSGFDETLEGWHQNKKFHFGKCVMKGVA